MTETRRRTIAKTLSWRVVATAVTSGVAYLLTDEVALALEIGLLDTTLKLFAYYGHERLWLRINYGIKRLTDYQI